MQRRCPVHSPYARGSVTRGDGNYGGAVSYEPNSFGGPVEDPSVKEPPLKISGEADRYDHRVGNDDYTQPGDLFRLMNPDQKKQLIQNLVNAMKTVPKEIQEQQGAHFAKADPAYGEGVAKGLGIAVPKPKAA